MKANGWP